MQTPSHEANAAWHAQVERELRGADFERTLVRRTLDGIEQKPVYARPAPPDAVGEPGAAPYRRGSRWPDGLVRPWQLLSRIDAAAPEQARAEALEELRGGADALWLQADRATRLAGSGAPGEGGIDLGGRRALARVLDGVQTEILALHLDAGAAAAAVAHELLELLAERGTAADSAVHCGVDPLGTLAACGALPGGWDAAWSTGLDLLGRAREFPKLRVFRIDALPAHAAGASEGLELGVALAGLTELLRAADARGADLATVAGATDLRVGVGRETLLEIAKVRALRELWTRVLTACEVEAPAPFVHAVASPRTLTRRDPWTNLLRATTQGFAAAVSGADAITLLPLDAALQRPGRLGRRMARNTQHVLAEEAQLGAITDPAGGSFALEAWTDELVEIGWSAFQEIEAEGGLAATLQSGWLHDRLADQRELRNRAFATRREAITGVSEFATLEEKRPEPGPASEPDAESWRIDSDLPSRWQRLLADAPSSETPDCEPLPVVRDAAAYEELRDAADAWAAAHADRSGGTDAAGEPPKVYLATLGSLAEHHARASFARNLFTAGGFACVDGDRASEWRASEAVAACICGTDDAYADDAASLVEELRELGAPRVLLAGKPSALQEPARVALEQAGLDGAIHLGCDALAVLRDLHVVLGAAPGAGEAGAGAGPHAGGPKR